jgi:galactonate dehydratase
VKVTTRSGCVGWGESYAIVAPGAVAEIIADLLGPLCIGRDARDPVPLHEDLYDTMRVRGFISGYFVDALAASTSPSGMRRRSLPDCRCAACSAASACQAPGLCVRPAQADPAERVELAQHWQEKGFGAVKFAAAVADEARRPRWPRSVALWGPACGLPATCTGSTRRWLRRG